MTREELLEIIAEVKRHRSELPDVEVKAARGGIPKGLFKSLSAFSNRAEGGVVLFGVDESRDFAIVGVDNAQRLQEEIGNLAASEMEPSLHPEFTIESVEGQTVVAVEMPPLSPTQKPCYHKPSGLHNGSFIRIGNTIRRMSDYEIFGYVSARNQPAFDGEPVLDASLDDLDREKIEDYLNRLNRARPQAMFMNQPFEQVLVQLGVVRAVERTLRPTLAGLLVFGKYPQAKEPQLVITFLQFYGTTETEKTPRGERFLDNRKFEGAIPEMVENAVKHMMASLRKSSLIEGLWRRDIPEYPEEAVREMVVNAVAHRDYSQYVRGSYIQIRLFADRLEVQSPGGLYGNVTEDNLEEEQSTRNRLLMRLMEDLHLVENRGSGIRTMIEAMRKANLEPPRFQDKRSSFWVILRNHTLLSPEALDWLNQFADKPLNDRQRLSLVYMRLNERMTNSDYQRLSRVDSVTANRELHAMVQAQLIEQHNTKRWAYYKLPVPQSDEEKILAYVRKHGFIRRIDCQQLLGVTAVQARYLLTRMRREGHLHLQGRKRGARYVLMTGNKQTRDKSP